MIVIKKAIFDKKRKAILEPYFAKNMTILYKADKTVKQGMTYIVKMDKKLINAGKDKKGVPVFIRKCSIINDYK